VIGTSGSESSNLLYLDKGTKDGIRSDMPVITPDGIVGKVLTVYDETAQVLMISDPTSGVGATLANSRLKGIVNGTSGGELRLNYIMGDETVRPGEALVTSGGDRVFPKGLPIGTVVNVSMGRNLFLDIKLKPAVDLDRLEEVLIVTEQKPRAPDTTDLGSIGAADILAQHLPGVPASSVAPPQPSSAAAAPVTAHAEGSKPKPAAPVPAHGDASKPKPAVPAPAHAEGSKPKPAAGEGTPPQ
jgi:rod shape-determining protein MreC